MRPQARTVPLLCTAALALMTVIAPDGPGLRAAPRKPSDAKRPFTTEFRLADCTFASTGSSNPYFILQPGHRLDLAADEDGEAVMLSITVLRDTERIDVPGVGRVETRVVEEREWVDGELVEVSRNFFAMCQETSDVFYFGEEVDFYEGGVIVGHDGAWRAGVGGALPGLIMPGRFLLGSRYFQEIAPGVALDRGENLAMGLTVETPAGVFRDCVSVTESSALESGTSLKIYAPGVGLIADGSITLVSWTR